MYDANPALQTAETAFIRARIWYRDTDTLPKAIALLTRLKVSNDTDSAQREALLGNAYARAGDPRRAASHFAKAEDVAAATGNANIIATVANHIGLGCVVMPLDLKKAREQLALVRKGTSPQSRLDALQLEAIILQRETRFRDQARVLTELLSNLEPHTIRHVQHRVTAVEFLALIARELYRPDAVTVVERHVAAPFPADFALYYFQSVKAVAWAKALQGDYFNAFRFLKLCTNHAPDDAWRTMALCDRAYFAFVRNETTWFRQELADAQEAAEKVDWESRYDDSIVALLLLAELFSPIDAPQAAAYLARFTALGGVRGQGWLFKNDDRLLALMEYSTGVVETHLDNADVAIVSLQNALKIYERVGFEWRAARTALRLYDVTKKTSYLNVAGRYLTHYQNSWLYEELRSRQNSRPLTDKLSPMRRRVFDLLCEGKTNAEIADDLDLAVTTAANHAKAVLKIFGVPSRHALVAEAMRRGFQQQPITDE
jgi:DNA-binding CsgD family transcriptional regulator